MIFGDLLVSHFSFYTQERRLLQTDILETYYDLAGLPAPQYAKPQTTLREHIRRWRKRKQGPEYRIALRDD
jgi:hypothetical protein